MRAATSSGLQDTVAAAIRRLGAREVARRLEISLESTLRLASGETVRRVTELHARANLKALAKTTRRATHDGDGDSSGVNPPRDTPDRPSLNRAPERPRRQQREGAR
jgi:hypothetical protein